MVLPLQPYIERREEQKSLGGTATISKDLCKPYHVCATVKRRCLGMLLLRSILRRSLGEFLGEITGESLGEIDFLAVFDFSCCNRFSRKDFTRSSFSQGFEQCRLSTSGTVKVSGLVVCWAIFPRSTLYSWQQSRATWFPGLFPGTASLRVRRNVQGSRSDPAAASSRGGPPQSLGGDGAGCRRGSALLSGSLLNVTPPLWIPCQRSPWSSPAAEEHGGKPLR